ncbi:phage tail protein [Hymenobacter gummosus]|uniref:Phage tail protein n=1 Tax=Hymenobacter gummosus TaxID=1776032 RepID=A0A3S0H2U1_9BACT|nr:tail fiber protein [Hymenobacter gummosus]RTQ47177.1 phage tail protein [Hymenobacter gummosus]
MDNYLGEIRMFAGNFAPQGWFFCQGQLLSISQYDALFALLGTTYGGDGMTTFALPNMQSRVIVGQGPSQSGTAYPRGTMGGSETVGLTTQQMPAHSHAVKPVLNANQGGPVTNNPVQALPATSATDAYNATAGASMGAGAIADAQLGPAGNSQPHNNLQPVQAINYIIAWEGIYPSTN